MQTLEALLRGFAAQSHGCWWIGTRPAVAYAHLASAIAKQVGLPSTADDPLTGDRMTILDKVEAARVLAVAGTTSLAYGEPSPSRKAVQAARAALDDLAPDATFLSNGQWKPGAPLGWNSLTSATFDCGVIGFDRENAFIFWVEEED